MNIPSLPTDNLYKFVSLSSLLMIIAATYIVGSFIFEMKSKIYQAEEALMVTIVKQKVISENANLLDKLEDMYSKATNEYGRKNDLPMLNDLMSKHKKLLKESIKLNKSNRIIHAQLETFVKHAESDLFFIKILIIFYSICLIIGIYGVRWGFAKWYSIQLLIDAKLIQSLESPIGDQ